MTFSIRIALLSLSQLFRSRSVLLIVLLMPFCLSALVTIALQFSFEPAVTYFNNTENQKLFINHCAQNAKEGGKIFQNESDIYPTVKKELEKVGVDRDVPELAELSVENFLSVILPPLFPKFNRVILESKYALLQTLIVLSSLIWLPSFMGVFLLNTETKNKILVPIFAKGVSSFAYILGKIIAGGILALLLTILTTCGMFIGLLVEPSSVAINNNLLTTIIANVAIICFSGIFCAITISLVIALLLPELKSQILISVVLTPILASLIYLISIKDCALQSSAKLIQSEFSVIKTERIPLDKNKVDLMAERQILNYAQMFAVKLGSDLIPRAVKNIPVSKTKNSTNIAISTLNTYLIVVLGCTLFASFLSLFKFRNH